MRYLNFRDEVLAWPSSHTVVFGAEPLMQVLAAEMCILKYQCRHISTQQTVTPAKALARESSLVLVSGLSCQSMRMSDVQAWHLLRGEHADGRSNGHVPHLPHRKHVGVVAEGAAEGLGVQVLWYKVAARPVAA